MKSHRLSVLYLSVLAAGSIAAYDPAPSFAQQGAAPGRAQDAETQLVVLPGNTHAFAQPRFDQGVVVLPGVVAERQLLILKRSARQEAALESFLRSVQDPRSADYQKFITPEQFGKLYGVSDVDLHAVVSWLQGQGLTVNKVNKGRTAIEFSGTVNQLETAFHTSIHSYLIGSERHYANASDPMIPAALASLISGVANLNDFKPRPYLERGPSATWNPALRRFQPDLTLTSNGSNYLFVVPGDAATIYDAPDSLNGALKEGQTVYDGTGVTIGIVSNTDLSLESVQNYRSLFGLTTAPLSFVFDGDESNLSTTNDTEALLDVEVSGALAPGASQKVYEAGDTLFQSGVILAALRAIEDNAVNILSVSFGECEADLGMAGNLEVLNLWQQAAAQGITVTVASGDSGSAACDNPNTETVATNGLAVNGLASTPYNIAVGGTDYDVLPSHFSTYVSSANGTNYTSALGYIPENPWNDSTNANGALASNVPEENSGATNIEGGGGGASSLGSMSGNGDLSGYSKPQWQTAYPLSDNDSVRDLPDVSLLAANGMYNAVWALCGDSDCSGSQPTISGVGGTSAATPAFAGILALVNEKVGASTRLGQGDWVLYRLAQTTPGVFHQVSTGNNSVYCSAGTSNCGTNHFLTGYNASSGYSFATGLGSVDIAQLVDNWQDVSFTSTQTSLSLNQTSFVHGSSVNVNASVNPAAATGSIAVVNNSLSEGQNPTNPGQINLPLVGGSASGSYSQFPGGSYNVYANYGGDGTYAGSTSAGVKVTVSPEDSILNLSAVELNSSSQVVNLAGQTVPLGTLMDIDAQPVGKAESSEPNPPTDATGTMYFTDSVTDAGYQVPLDSSGNAVMQTMTMGAGSHSFSASYDGDASYNGSTSSAVAFNITKATTSVTVTSNVSSIYSGQLILTAQIMSTLAPSLFASDGTITFTDTTNNTVLGTAASNGNFCTPAETNCLSGAIDANANQLAMGANTVVASFSGNSNFLASAQSPSVTVTCTAGCSNGTGQLIYLAFGQQSAGTISPGGTITATVSAIPQGGFTGAVNLTCSVAGRNSADTEIPTCSFNPAQVSVTNATAASTLLTISTSAPTTGSLERRRPLLWPSAGDPILAVVFLLGIRARKQRARALLGVLLFVLAAAWVSGCGGAGQSGGGGGGGGNGGGGGSGGGGAPGTTADTYTVTFHAADAATGTVTAQDYFNFIVQ